MEIGKAPKRAVRQRVGRWVSAALVLGVALALSAASCQSGDVIWSADHETGDISQWLGPDGQSGGIFNSNTPPGTARVWVTDRQARSGDHSVALRITGADNAQQGARLFRTWVQNNVVVEELPDRAYYSAWFLFPRRFDTQDWWNIFQFKSRDSAAPSESLLSFNVGNQPDGDMELYVYHHGPNRSYAPTADVALPVGEWVHIEAWLDISSTANGQVQPDGGLRVWVDGTRIINRTGIRTLRQPNGWINWSVNNYTDDLRPVDATIFVDDAAISRSRLSR